MTIEEIIATAIPVIMFIGLIMYVIYVSLEDRWKTHIIKYYTIELNSLGFYTITLWVSEVYTYRNKCKKRPVEVESLVSPYEHDIDNREARYNRSGIYPMHRTPGAEKCLLKNYY